MTDQPQVHFVAGLPRSGSTLLSVLLRQNPRFVASVTSPVLDMSVSALRRMGAGTEFSSFFDDARRARILRALLLAYHDPAPNRIVFDTARLWTRHLALVATLWPTARVICCVRDVPRILDSVERLLHKNPLQTSALFDHTPGLSISARISSLMEQNKGFVGAPWNALREAWFGPYAAKLIVLRYESLASRPSETLDALYDALGEPRFPHRFEGLSHDEAAYDARLGMPGLHSVRGRVGLEEPPNCLPPEAIRQYAAAGFWAEGGPNPGGVRTI